MRRRLFDGPDQGLGEEVHLIEGVRAPNRDRGCCSLMVALEAALAAMGQGLSYPDLMGQSGAGFMLRIEQGFAATPAQAGREAQVVEALRELGRQARLLPHPEAATALQECREQTRANRPLLALGWGSNPGEWSVIVGFQGEDLLGHPFGGTGRPERHPPVVGSLLLLDETIAPLSRAETLAHAIARALPLLQANQLQYAAWLSLLEADEPYGPALTQLELFSREQWLSACLVDARDAAARFLLQHSEDDENHHLLEQAANVAERLAEQAEELVVPPDAVQRAHLPQDLDWRQQRREIIGHLRNLERELHELLRRAVSGAGDGF